MSCLKFSGDSFNGQAHGYGILELANGNVYKGDFCKGLAHGKGILCKNNKIIYKGEFEQGLYSGHGILYYTDGSQYEGNFSKGLKQGQGSMTIADGETYKGWFEHGILTDQDQSLTQTKSKLIKFGSIVYEYSGSLKNDQPHGPGTYRDVSTQHLYSGNSINGFPDISAIFTVTYKDTDLSDYLNYLGTLKDFQRHGNGKLWFRDGRTYDGEFQNGEMHGYGKSTYPNGATHEGQVAHGMMLGQGTYTSADGQICQGIFPETGTINYPDGDYYNGSIMFVNHKYVPQGSGKTIFKNGIIHEGKYYIGVIYGQGKLTYPNGSQFEGSVSRGEILGSGTFVNSKGDRACGNFPSNVIINYKESNQIYTGSILMVCDESDNYECVPHGHGKLSWDSNTFTGSFHQGKPESGSMVLADGVYEGPVSENFEAHGEGQMSYQDGEIYKGEFKQGCREGSGTLTLTNKSYFQGPFVNDVPHGKGLLYDYDTKIGVSVEFEHGKLKTFESVINLPHSRLISQTKSIIPENKNACSETRDPVSETRDPVSETRDPVSEIPIFTMEKPKSSIRDFVEEYDYESQEKESEEEWVK